MTTQTMQLDPISLETDLPQISTLGSSLLAGFIGACQDAQCIQRGARQLYALSDANLRAQGLQPANIPARLTTLSRG